MTDLNNSAPATAGEPSPSCWLVLLSGLSAAVAALTGASCSILETSPAGLLDAVNNIDTASDAVDTAVSAVVTAFSGLSVTTGALPAPPPVPTLPAFLRTAGPWMAGLLYAVVPAMPLGAIPDNNDKWFAITRSKDVGLTRNSAISLAAVTGVSTAISEKHATQAEALSYFNDALLNGAVVVIQ
ncbi:hypothetical protein C8R43DRAFT_958076 [Mycena crocata]|nr:hypothetical protein C8R43DRAFT_958076 [Mycena crocata]